MATQRAVGEYLKAWLEAEAMQDAVKAADAAAREFDGLYTESAKNLLARSPDLMLLLSAYMAGKRAGEEAERKRLAPKQGELIETN
jgi:hypothetical protein